MKRFDPIKVLREETLFLKRYFFLEGDDIIGIMSKIAGETLEDPQSYQYIIAKERLQFFYPNQKEIKESLLKWGITHLLSEYVLTFSGCLHGSQPNLANPEKIEEIITNLNDLQIRFSLVDTLFGRYNFISRIVGDNISGNFELFNDHQDYIRTPIEKDQLAYNNIRYSNE